MPDTPVQADNTEGARPEWFAAFLADHPSRCDRYKVDQRVGHVAIAHAPDSSQSRMTLADCHSRVFAEYHPDRTTLMFSRITLNFSRIGHCWQNG